MDERVGLTIPRAAAASMLDHARSALPNEACGLLSGDRAAGHVDRFHPARNEHRSPWRFSVAADDLVRIVLSIERGDGDLVAIFHSHPTGPAEPSAADVRGAAAYPAALHVLAAPAGPGSRLRAWRIRGEDRREVPLRVV